jgi:hypothetical protein
MGVAFRPCSDRPFGETAALTLKMFVNQKEDTPMYDKKELCDRIKSLYPEMGECGIDVKVDFDEAKKVWTVELDKEAHHLKTYLEPMDAATCMEGKQCVSLGLQIAQLIANIKTVG